jgi:hypothetical protein
MNSLTGMLVFAIALAAVLTVVIVMTAAGSEGVQAGPGDPISTPTAASFPPTWTPEPTPTICADVTGDGKAERAGYLADPPPHPQGAAVRSPYTT